MLMIMKIIKKMMKMLLKHNTKSILATMIRIIMKMNWNNRAQNRYPKKQTNHLQQMCKINN